MPPAKKQKVPGTSPGKTPKPMTHGGDSVDWENGKKNHKRIGKLFLEHSQNAEWGQVWDDVPEAELCKQSFWGSFATYLVAIYRISLQAHKNPGKPLASASAAGVWSGLIEDTKNAERACRLDPGPAGQHRRVVITPGGLGESRGLDSSILICV